MKESYQAPGDVTIKQLYLISPNKNKFVSLIDYLVEMNIYESIFSSTISGNLVISDNRNIIREFPILGEEILLVELKTPTFEDNLSIYRTFRVFSLGNKNYVRDGNSLIYKLEFCSQESFVNSLSKVYGQLKGKPEDIISKVYTEYLKTERAFSVDEAGGKLSISAGLQETQLNIVTKTANNLKFVSPGWSPLKCINWICSKSEAENSKANNFLFWETTKGFYFSSSDKIFDSTFNVTIGSYTLTSSLPGSDSRSNLGIFTIKDIANKKVFNQLENVLTGYLASRVIDVNLYNKTFENYDYDHGLSYFRYSHTEGENSLPLFDPFTARNPESYKQINYNYPNLYNDSDGNFPEKNKFIYGNRRSTLMELNNFDMEIVIPGRTDIEAGSLIFLNLPAGKPPSPGDKAKNLKDDMFSGYYLITTLNHKINRLTHYTTMTVSKDSYSREYYNAR